MDKCFGRLGVIGMRGCENFTEQVDDYLKKERKTNESFIIKVNCPRFGTGEAKAIIEQSIRGMDIYIIADVFNYDVTFNMYGKYVPMSPDDHFADLKRIIGAIAGKARRITVIMPMLYEGRQHKRSYRESLDCAMALQELVNIGVTNILTFDAHDSMVQNAIPIHGFDNIHSTYQFIKAAINNIPQLSLSKDKMIIISPDAGGMARCMYYSSVLGLDIGMFYKRRNFSVLVNGRNPIEAHEYLGKDVAGKDVIIVDDMISSGDSIIDVSEQLKKRGAKRIFVFATFGLFVAGVERFNEAYKKGLFDKIFTTNLIYRSPELLKQKWYCEVNLCKYTASMIETLNRDSSISDLLSTTEKINTYIKKAVKSGKLK